MNAERIFMSISPRASRGRRGAAGLLATFVAIGAAAVATMATSTPAQASSNGLALKPQMGWSSWSFIRRTPTAAKIQAQAQAIHDSGLQAVGYNYINIDDFYQVCDSNGFTVDNFGRWVTDTSTFPQGLKGVGDFVHNLGFKFGVYVTPGIPKNAVLKNTPIEGTSFHAKDIADTSKSEKNYNCKGMYYIDYNKNPTAAQAYLNSWAKQFASFGADYLKIDGVGSFDIPDVQHWKTALESTGRPIHYELSNNLDVNFGSTWKSLANGWRTQGDVECYCGPGPNGSGFPLTNWSHVQARFAKAQAWQKYAGPGGWNDLDSIEVGNGSGDGLTVDERKAHMSLWAMASSPFVLGTDLTHLDSTDKGLLLNTDVISVDQDAVAALPFGSSSDTTQVWHKKEANGDYVVGLFNNDTSTHTLSVTWSQLGISGSASVRDLWARKDLGVKASGYSVSVPTHGASLIRIHPGGSTGGGDGALLSQGQPITASSEGGTGYVATNANDGSTATRWASVSHVDPQWIRVDLGSTKAVGKVRLTWDVSCATAYKIQLSNDDATYTDAFTTTTGAGGTEDVTVSGSARYVRMFGSVRCRDAGYSLQEFQVFAPAAATPFTLVNPASSMCLDDTGASTTNGTLFEIWTCHAGQGQTFTPVGKALQFFGTKCVTAAGTTSGSKVQVQDCNSSAAQQWTFNSNGTVTAASGLCLDVVGGSTTRGAGVDVATCNTGSGMQWKKV
jgi:hypothetical protein